MRARTSEHLGSGGGNGHDGTGPGPLDLVAHIRMCNSAKDEQPHVLAKVGAILARRGGAREGTRL